MHIIEEKVITIIKEITLAEVDVIKESNDFIKDFQIDSMRMLELIVKIESGLNISFPDELLLVENFNNFKKIIGNVNECIHDN